jgi:hypothetical protein
MNARPERLLTFRSGGWVLCLSLVISVGVVALTMIRSRERLANTVGDGVHVESYGFDLEGALVPAERIRASGLPRDGLGALVDPRSLDAEQAVAREGHKRIVVPKDRVIGVEIGGEARAYPLRLLAAHVVANDVVGGVPIAVTYDAFCDSAVVVDRRVGDTTLLLRFSGLLLNGNILLFDEADSLWSQLQTRAVAGPAARAGTRLRPLRCSLVRWETWLARHPKTSMLAPVPGLREAYKQATYGLDRDRGRLQFPVEPYPPPGDVDAWDRVVVVRKGDRDWVFALSRIVEKAGDFAWVTEDEGLLSRFDPADDGRSVAVEAVGADAVMYANWFAWYAAHPTAVVEP